MARLAQPEVLPRREQLEALVRWYRHLQNEHKRAAPESATHRRIEERLLEVREEFDRVLEEWVPEESLRRAWREHSRLAATSRSGGAARDRGRLGLRRQEQRERPADAHKVSAQTTPSARSTAMSLQDQFVSVVKSVSPAVVQIQTNAGLGSGVVYDTKGDIVTNAHVVGEAKSFVVTLASGETHKGTLVGTFPAGDLAVVRIEGARPKPAAFADSSKVRVGDFALAIGNPLGLRSSVTDGIVSSRLKPGKKVPVEIVRSGHRQKLTVELGQLPGS